MPEPVQWAQSLASRLSVDLGQLRGWSAYYEGTQPLSYISPALLRELEGRIRNVVVNWPRLVVDSLEERLDIEGFRFGSDAEGDTDLWNIWQANNLDEGSQQAHVEALVHGRSYAIVGPPIDGSDAPRITVESPLQVITSHDPQTRQVRAAYKRWLDDVALGGDGSVHEALYLPGENWYWSTLDGRRGEPAVTTTGLDVVPVVPLVNRGRPLTPLGVSELADVVPLSDAACKIATDMMVGAEFHALPRRWVAGLQEGDFTDENGRPLSTWKRDIGRLWATENENAKMGQFTEASLENFHATINQLAMLVASLTGLPPYYLGLTTTNPASADAIRSSESRLVKRAERRQRAFGGGWEQVMRLALLVRDGSVPDDARSLETLWADAATPTVAQQADAALKLVQAGIVPVEQAREDLGYTSVQRQRMADMSAEAAARGDAALSGIFAAGAAPTEPVPPQA